MTMPAQEAKGCPGSTFELGQLGHPSENKQSKGDWKSSLDDLMFPGLE
jgi:hypothetical protein